MSHAPDISGVPAYGERAFFVVQMPNDSTLFVTKDAKGEYRWVLISSSAYVDRDGEIVTEKALKQAVDRMEASGDYGELRWWHTPIVLGHGDFADVHAHQLIESGTFVNEAVARGMAKAASGLGASIGFNHPPTQPKNKAYHDIDIKERSLLPRGKESNLFTTLNVTGGKMDEKRLKELINHIGEDEATALLERAESRAKEADGKGMKRKEAKSPLERFLSIFEAKDADPDPDEDNADDATDEPETVDDAEDVDAAAETDKAAKKDEGKEGDDDAKPVTRREMKAALSALRGELAKSAKATEKATSELATKEEVRAVADTLGKVEKGIKSLIDDQPRIFGRGYRASADDSNVNKEATEKKKQDDNANPIYTLIDQLDGKAQR